MDSDTSRSKTKLDKEKKKSRAERGGEEKKKDRGRSDGGGKEGKEGIDGSQSSDAVEQRKRKRKKAHRLGDDSLASIGLDDISPPFKKSKDMIKKSSSASLHSLAGSVSLHGVTQPSSKTSRSESSLDTLQGRVNKRARGVGSVLCNMAGTGTATGTGIKAKAGSRAGSGTGAGKEKMAGSKALASVTQKDNDHDIR